MYTDKNLTDSPTPDDQDRLKAEKEGVVAAEAVAAVVSTVYNKVLLDVNKEGDWEGEGAVGLDALELAGVKRKLREMQ